MLEKVIELLLGLAVGAAGVVGLSTAVDATAEAQVSAPSVADKVAAARQRVDEIRRDVEGRATAEAEAEADAAVESDGDVEAAGVDGRANAAAAIEAAMELAPEAADVGLENAWEHVTTAPAGQPAAGDGSAEDASVEVEADASVNVDVSAGLGRP
jgi:hypothetical protein